MNKLIAALVACTFSIGAFAQMAASAPGMSSDMGASKPMMMKKKHHMKKHHGKKSMKAASAASS